MESKKQDDAQQKIKQLESEIRQLKSDLKAERCVTKLLRDTIKSNTSTMANMFMSCRTSSPPYM